MWIYRVFYLLNALIYVKPPKKCEYKLYLEKHIKQFIDDYDTSQNANIEGLYNFEESDKIMSNADNHLEKIWKTRILYQTVRLKNDNYINVIMHYEPYKQAFVYYCDINIHYDSLNILAMKYVRYFQCIDFFIDEEILKNVENNNVFLKRIKNDVIKTKNKFNENGYIKNKFIYLGKIVNFNFLKKEKRKAKSIGYSKFKELFN